jgi:hypothetical protein
VPPIRSHLDPRTISRAVRSRNLDPGEAEPVAANVNRVRVTALRDDTATDREAPDLVVDLDGDPRCRPRVAIRPPTVARPMNSPALTLRASSSCVTWVAPSVKVGQPC